MASKLNGVPESPSRSTEGETFIEALYDYLYPVYPIKNPKSKSMLQATSDYFGWLANQHPEVLRFRDEVLGGRILAPDETHKLLGSYAARFFPHEWFLKWGIPVVGHTSEIVGEYDWGSNREIDHRVTVRVEPLRIIKRVRYAHPDTPTCLTLIRSWAVCSR